ncbi:MAG: phenylacetate--CoA ligase family protein [Solirubrobacterales bacterium]
MWLSLNKDKYGEYFENKNREVSGFYAGSFRNDDIQAIQERKLNEVLQYVIRQSKYYSQSLSKYKDVEVKLSDLKNLPFTTKGDLQEQLQDIMCIDFENAFVYCETSGTTGKAVPCPRSAVDKIFVNLNWTYGWRNLLGTEKKHIIGISGPTELYGMVDTFSDVFNNLGHCIVKINPFAHRLSFEKALEVMKDLKMTAFCGTPTVCMMLAKATKIYGYDIKQDFALERIFLTGELCSNAMAKNISRIWGAKAINHPYASQELFSISTACPNDHLHFLPLDYIYEVVDYQTGEYIGETGVGELVITMLEKGAKPLIRFKTGDYVKVERETGCAFPSLVVHPFGRVKDILLLNDKEVTAFEIEDLIIDELESCYGYSLSIDTVKDKDFLNIELDLEDKEKLTPEISAKIVSKLQERFRVNGNLTVKELSKETTLGANIGWKAARVKDNRVPMDAEKALALEMGKRRVIKSE